MLTALIRNHPGREVLFQRAVKSCKGVRVIEHFDNGWPREDYSYNLICNYLKSQVFAGFFFFLDSDDYILPGAVEKLIPQLEVDKANIVKMLRNGRPKGHRIERGFIGLPCLVLHHSHKAIADVTARVQGDFDWIEAVTKVLPVKLIDVVLVDAGKRSNGK